MPVKTHADEIPDDLVEVQRSLDNLKYAMHVRKTIANLPKGKLRDHIEAEVNAIIDHDESPLKETLKKVESFNCSVNELYAKCVELINVSRTVKLTRETVQDLVDLIDKVRADAHSYLGFKGTYK